MSSYSPGGQAISPKRLWLQLSCYRYLRNCQVWPAVCLLQKDRPVALAVVVVGKQPSSSDKCGKQGVNGTWEGGLI